MPCRSRHAKNSSRAAQQRVREDLPGAMKAPSEVGEGAGGEGVEVKGQGMVVWMGGWRERAGLVDRFE